MYNACIYIINSQQSSIDSMQLIKTFCGSAISFIYQDDIEFGIIDGGYIKNEDLDVVFEIQTRGPYKDFAEILSQYVSGKLKEMANIIGYLILLRVDLLNFSPGSQKFSYTQRVRDDFATFRRIVSNRPYAIVLGFEGNKMDNIDAVTALIQTVQTELQVDKHIQIIPCDFLNRDEVKAVILKLMDQVDEFPERNRLMTLLKA